MSSISPAGVVDDEWLSAPSERSRLRMSLLVLLAVALVFFAGVEVQKRYGAAATAASPLASARPAGFTGFTGAGGPPGIGTGTGTATGTGSTTGSTTGTTGGTTGGATAAAGQAVIGTLVSVKGDVWTIKDLGGHVHTVTVGSTVQIVKETSLSAADVVSGSTLDVSGTTDAQGHVTATAITVR